MKLFKTALLISISAFLTMTSAWIAISSVPEEGEINANNTSVLSADTFEVQPTTPFLAYNLSSSNAKSKNVTFINRGRQPLRVFFEPLNMNGTSPSTSNKMLFSIKKGNNILLKQKLSSLTRDGFIILPPNSSNALLLRGELGNNSTNVDQNQKFTFDINWKAVAQDTPPPPECKYQRIRSRLFVNKRRPFMRLITRYRASSPGRVVTRFYERRSVSGVGVRGRLIASMKSLFRRTSGTNWRKNRIRVRISRREARRLRNSRNGFIATMSPAKTPGYCYRFLTADLVTLKRRFGGGQFIWFQKGSF